MQLELQLKFSPSIGESNPEDPRQEGKVRDLVSTRQGPGLPAMVED
jgi:hypothetical protein